MGQKDFRTVPSGSSSTQRTRYPIRAARSAGKSRGGISPSAELKSQRLGNVEQLGIGLLPEARLESGDFLLPKSRSQKFTIQRGGVQPRARVLFRRKI